MTAIKAADLIERTSERLCRSHYRMGPLDTWYFGGSSHNDDRLWATVGDDGLIRVKCTDGHYDTYEGPLEAAEVVGYVRDWLNYMWTN
jgi:hypothetical protein